MKRYFLRLPVRGGHPPKIRVETGHKQGYFVSESAISAQKRNICKRAAKHKQTNRDKSKKLMPPKTDKLVTKDTSLTAVLKKPAVSCTVLKQPLFQSGLVPCQP